MNKTWRYLLKRITQIIGVVFLLSVATFLFSVNGSIDPVDQAFERNAGSLVGAVAKANLELQKEKRRVELGMYLPTFYISLSSIAINRSIYSVHNKDLKAWVAKEAFRGYNCDALAAYANEQIELLSHVELLDNEAYQIAMVQRRLDNTIEGHLLFLKKVRDLELSPEIRLHLLNCENLLKRATDLRAIWKTKVPVLRFHKNNRYHQWLFGSPTTGKGFIRGDFGRSVITRKKVSKHILNVLPWTLVLSALSIFISLFGSIFIGVLTAYFNGSAFDKITHSVLFLTFTVPSFWMATLLLMFFANPDYLNWFPSGGVAPLQDFAEMPSVWERIAASSKHLVLPLVCFSYGGFSYLSRLTRSSATASLNATYIFSARARGLKEQSIVFKHVLKNALLPLITIVGSILPALFGGSLIIERIFSIPGLGGEVFQASMQNDINLLMAIFTISGLLSAIGYLISDILYRVIDPRIRLEDM